MKRLFGILAVLLLALVAIFFAPITHALPAGSRGNVNQGNGVFFENGAVKIHYEVRTETSTSNTKISETNVSGTGEYIESFDTETAIQKDGSISVTERILYHFSEPRHGIFRTIPFTKTNETGKRYAMSIENVRVTDEQQAPYTVVVSKDSDTMTYKIGDADTTVSGAKWYVVHYTVKGALTYFPGHDELYWNTIGTTWKIPIIKASAKILLPSAISSEDIHMDCFVGSQGSQEKSCSSSFDKDRVLIGSSRPLGAYEGLTVVVGFPKNLVAVMEPMEIVPFFETGVGKIVLLILGITAVLWYFITPLLVIRRWFASGRDPKPAMGEVAAWFTPPKNKHKRNLTPAETGTLIDERADMRDIYASIVDLARRGFLKIIETKKNTFSFEKMKDWVADPSLEPFERELLKALFNKGDMVKVASLDVAEEFEAIKKLLYESLVSQQFFPSNPNSIRAGYMALAVVAFITVNPLLLIIALTFGQNMPRKTLYGSEQAAIARSLKNFLTSQDKHLAFQAKNQMMFEKLLPYAIAFGVEEIWASRFKELGIQNPDWYVSSTGSRFYSVAFAHSIGTGLNASFSRSITSHSSRGFSSGFSSGGGFSGGGGGGGGGGSW